MSDFRADHLLLDILILDFEKVHIKVNESVLKVLQIHIWSALIKCLKSSTITPKWLYLHGVVCSLAILMVTLWSAVTAAVGFVTCWRFPKTGLFVSPIPSVLTDLPYFLLFVPSVSALRISFFCLFGILCALLGSWGQSLDCSLEAFLFCLLAPSGLPVHLSVLS